MHPVRFFILMGVAGCGKSSYGARLADQLQATYLDGDDFHPPENIAKMSAGIALDDADRWPWLDEIAANMAKAGRRYYLYRLFVFAQALSRLSVGWHRRTGTFYLSCR